MSINQFSSDLPDTIWWTQHQAMDPNSHTTNNNNSSSSPPEIAPSGNNNNYNHLYHHHSQWYDSRQSPPNMVMAQNPCRNFNLNHNHKDVGDEEDDDRSSTVEQHQRQEVMFEKALTPSDVGKLNRLVIPKQHAEKYFPLGGDSGDKGLLLGFEDESGKSWRFRYSYWNSSQSYVLTKGWSRYVKEKQLDAGDVVFFERHRNDPDRFFIGWRRRNAAQAQDGSVAASQNNTAAGTGDQWTRVYYPNPAHAYPALSPTLPLPYQQPHCSSTHAGTGSNIVPTTVPAGNLKRLRLFGVNMECQSEEYEPSTPDGDGSSSVSSQGGANYHHYYSSQAYASNHQNQMDTSWSGDVKQQMRRGRG